MDQNVTGDVHSHLEGNMSVLGVPFLAKKTFVRTECGIGEWWQENLWECMLEAGRDFYHGVPAITMVVDRDQASTHTTLNLV